MVLSSNSSPKNQFGASGGSLRAPLQLKKRDLSNQSDTENSACSLLTLSSAAASEMLNASRGALGSLLLNALLKK
jgi:hypothetical protein